MSLKQLEARLRAAGVVGLGLTVAPGANPADARQSAIQLLNEYLDGKFTPVSEVGDAPVPQRAIPAVWQSLFTGRAESQACPAGVLSAKPLGARRVLA